MNKYLTTWYWKEAHRKVSAFFNPRQKWLTKQIPKTWCDKSELIPITLFAILVDFVENEMDRVNWDWADNHAWGAEEIKACYNYIKNERPILEKMMDDAYPEFKGFDQEYTHQTYEKEYGEVNRLERLLDMKDEDTMIRIIKVRHYLWT